MMPRLSITWQVRLLNAALSALILVALVIFAQARIRVVLFNALDDTLTEQARDVAYDPNAAFSGDRRRPPPGDFGEGDAPFDRPPPRDGRGEWNDAPPQRRGRDDRHRGEPPPLRFGALTLLPPRRVSMDGTGREPWSVAGRDAAARTGFDKRTQTQGDGSRLRVVSLRAGAMPMIVQVAGNTETIDATLREIDAALYALLLPIGAFAAIGGAFLTELALAPVRRLTQAVGSIESSNLSARLPEPGGGDAFDLLATRLNALLGRLDAAFARQKRFAGAASHELRTPLAVIKGATSLLLETPQTLSPLQARALSRADQSADRANRLITDLLTLARTENGTLPVRLASVEMRPLVEEVISGFDTPTVPIVAEVKHGLTVRTDADMVRRLLQNIVSNALRHTERGQITVSASGMGTVLTLTVADTGEGIAADVLPRLGEPFYRADSSRARDTGGAGLGLSLCREIVIALRGTLHIESTVGAGTTVRVVIRSGSRQTPEPAR